MQHVTAASFDVVFACMSVLACSIHSVCVELLRLDLSGNSLCSVSGIGEWLLCS